MSPVLRASPPCIAVLLLLSACHDAGPALRVEPAFLDLGSVAIGEDATARFVVENAGVDTVKLDAVVLVTGDAQVWQVQADTADLFPDARTDVTVTFAPVQRGPSHARLAVLSDDPAAPVVRLDVVGVGALDAQWGGDKDTDRGTGTGTGTDDGSGAGDTAETPDDHTAPTGCADADGDGHDLCDLGGDCDDADPSAFPVIVDAAAPPGGHGTASAPYSTIDEALGHLDARCRTVVLAEGRHEAAVEWDAGAVTVRGAGRADRVEITPPEGHTTFTVGDAGRLRLESLTLIGARAREDGGALRVEGEATLVAVHAIDDTSAGDGGAIAVLDGTLRLQGCTLSGNRAGEDGGAVFVGGGVVHDTGSVWSDNTADNGGALALVGGELAVDGSLFEDNEADDAGGAVALRGADDVRVERAAFTGNVAGARGGALDVDGADGGLVRNVLAQDNRAGAEGGGIAVAGPSKLLVANDTLVGNVAGGDGAGLWLRPDDDGAVEAWSNVVAWSVGDSAVWAGDDRGARVAYTLGWGASDVEMELSPTADAGGNLVGDPRFAAFHPDGLVNDDLSLLPGSAALDAGPLDGEGPDGYRQWADPDGTRNDRGHTGGPGAR